MGGEPTRTRKHDRPRLDRSNEPPSGPSDLGAGGGEADWPVNVDHAKLTIEEKSERMSLLEDRLLEPVDYATRDDELRELKDLQKEVMAGGNRDQLHAEHDRIHGKAGLEEWDERLEGKLSRVDHVQGIAERAARSLRGDDRFIAAISPYALARKTDGWAGVEQLLRYLNTQDDPGRDNLQNKMMETIREGVPELADEIIGVMKARGAHIARGDHNATYWEIGWDDVKSGAARDELGALAEGAKDGVLSEVENVGRHIAHPVDSLTDDIVSLIELPGRVADALANKDEIWRDIQRKSPKELSKWVGEFLSHTEAGLAMGGITKGIGGEAGEAARAGKGLVKGRPPVGRSVATAAEAEAGDAGRAAVSESRAARHGSSEAGPSSHPGEGGSGANDRPRLASEGSKLADPTNPQVRQRLHESIDATIDRLDSLDHPGTKVESKLHRLRPKEAPDAATRRRAEGKPVARIDEKDVRWVAEERLSPEVLRDRYGMPELNRSRIQQIANEEKVDIFVRPGKGPGARHLEEGAHAKFGDVAAKSIEKTDTSLGFRSEDVGKTGYRSPEPPPLERPPGMSQKEWDGVQASYRERHAEFWDKGNTKHMEELQKPPELQRGTKGEVQIGIDEHGVVHGKPRGSSHEAPLAGDHDIFEFSRNGEPVSPAEHDRIIKRMVDGDMGVRHGAHQRWEIDPKAENASRDIGKKETISQRHLSGDKELIRFRAGEEPVAVRAHPREVERKAETSERGSALRGDRQRRGEGVSDRGDRRSGETAKPRGDQQPPSEGRRTKGKEPGPKDGGDGGDGGGSGQM